MYNPENHNDGGEFKKRREKRENYIFIYKKEESEANTNELSFHEGQLQ